MPIFEVTAPDGRIVEVTAPDGATEQQAIKYAQDNWAELSRQSQPKEQAAQQPSYRTTAEEFPFIEQVAAGLGGGLKGLELGARQVAGYVSPSVKPSEQELSEYESAISGLRGTGGGLIGEFGSLIIPGAAVGGAVAKAPVIARALSTTGKGFAPASTRIGGLMGVAGAEGAAQGLLTPVMPDSDVTRAENVLKQGAFGAVAAPAVAGLLKGASIGKEVVKPYLPFKYKSPEGTYTGAEASQGKLLTGILGEDAASVRTALESAPEGMTAGQVAAQLNETQLPALESLLAKQYGSTAAYRAKKAAEEGREAALTPEDAKAIEVTRKEQTTPLRETALRKADIVTRAEQTLAEKAAKKDTSAVSLLQDIGRMATFGDQQIKRGTDLLGETTARKIPKKASNEMAAKIDSSIEKIDEELLTATSQSRITQLNNAKQGLIQYRDRIVDMGKSSGQPGGYIKEVAAGRLFERAREAGSAAQDMAGLWRGLKDDALNYRKQLASLNDRGLKGIKVGQIVSDINSIVKQPAIAASEAAPALNAVMQRIAATKGNPEALYTIKKEIGDIVKNTIKSTDPATSSKIASSVSARITPMIDDAINKASGGTWKEYLKTYGEISRKLDQSNVMSRLQSALTAPIEGVAERRVSFANALNNPENLISKATGQKMYETLDELMTPQQIETINKVKRQLDVESKAREAAIAGTEQLRNKLKDIQSFEGVSLIDRVATIVQNIIRRAKTGASEKTLQELATKIDDPKAIAKLMSYAEADERKQLASYMKMVRGISSGLVAQNRIGAEQ